MRAGNRIGDALEIITQKAIVAAIEGQPRYAYQGHFRLDEPRDKHGRIRKTQPPKSISSNIMKKEADFILFGHDEGPICVECKNYREWFYPTHGGITSTIIKSYELGATPLFIGRRIHYTTRENFFTPAGIIFHESFYQYYDPQDEDIAAQAKDKALLGFSDIRASHDPDKRTVRFFDEYLPRLLKDAAPRWAANRKNVYAYALGQMNLAQLYNEIKSPARGNWIEPEEQHFPEPPF